MAKATLTIASKNYGSWSLRGWLLCKMAGLDFDEQPVASDDPSARAELLLSIAQYLNETIPDSGMLPKEKVARAYCRSICGEMHSGFTNMRSALPMNLKAHHPGFKVWAGAQADIDRILSIWRECLAKSKGPFLFGDKPGMADAMFAPVVTRFITYDVKLDSDCAAYCKAIMALPMMQEWLEAAKAEPDEVVELDVEF